MKILKAVMIGNSSVGKTSIQTRFANQMFPRIHEMTIGVEFATRVINIGGKEVKIHLWDTAGQETFRSICRSYYRGADCAIVVYDVSNRQSFIDVQMWLEELRQYGSDDVQWLVVGNKNDLPSQVTEDDIVKLGVDHMFASAKNNHNILEIFRKVAYKKAMEPDIMYNRTINLDVRDERVCITHQPKCC